MTGPEVRDVADSPHERAARCDVCDREAPICVGGTDYYCLDHDPDNAPPPGALAPTSSHGCGDDGCEPCYGNEAWQRWNAERQGICWTCEAVVGGTDGHEADEECPWAGDAP